MAFPFNIYFITFYLDYFFQFLTLFDLFFAILFRKTFQPLFLPSILLIIYVDDTVSLSFLITKTSSIKNVLTSLAKSVLLPLGLTAGMAATDAIIQKKILRSGTTTLTISNKEM